MEKHLNKQQLDEIIIAIDSVPVFTITKDISEFAHEKVFNVIKSEGFKRPDSEKAKEFITNKPLFYEIEKDKKYLGIYVSYEPEMNATYRMMEAVKTKSGILYVENGREDKTGFLSHFFDRFAQRTRECDMIQRKKAIRRYLQTYKINYEGEISSSRPIDDESKKLLMLHPYGVCLGVQYKGYQILKTFIQYDMATKSQEKVINTIKNFSKLNKRHSILETIQSKGALSNDEKEELKLIKELKGEYNFADKDFNEFESE